MPSNSANPHESATREGREAQQATRLRVGVVDTVPDENVPQVSVRLSDGTTTPAEVPVAAHGDGYIPPVGSVVQVQQRRGDVPVVVNEVYTPDDDVPDLDAGERRIGHPLSSAHVDLLADGSVEVVNDSGTSIVLDGDTVTIDGGTDGVVTDVQTTTDADGHVTDVTLVRNGNIQV